jgi:lysine biosynthesis protein LysW
MGAHRKHKAQCPFCFAYAYLPDEIEVWDILTCEECGTPLQVVNLHPPEMDYIDDGDLGNVDYWDEEGWESHQFSQN